MHNIKLSQVFQSFDETFHNDSDFLQNETSLPTINLFVQMSMIKQLQNDIERVLRLEYSLQFDQV